MQQAERKIGLFPLIGIIMSAIIGAGIFNLMKEMSSTASVGVTIIGWIIAGVGMGSLAFCMESLIEKRPDLDAGIFSYAQAGFGDYIGFNSVWGYWLSVIIGNVAFGTLMFSALAYFFPIFGNGQNVPSIIGASIVLWLINYCITRGLEQATILNALVMIAKLVPIIIFIVCIIGAFHAQIFFHDFWGSIGSKAVPATGILTQLKGTVLSTMFVFIGVEGAVVFSARAKKRTDVGKATILGFGAVTLIYVLVTVFSYGLLTQSQLSKLPNPAMAYVLADIIGKPGAIIVNIGVIIAIFGAWMANTMLAEEVAYQAGKQQLFPKIFTKENKRGMPVNSTFITNLIVQGMLFSFFITDQAYSLFMKFSSATILLPYTCVALFQLKTNYQTHVKLVSTDMLVGIIATLYMFWLIYASGAIYLVLTILSLVPGTLMYIYVRRKESVRVFKPYEVVIFVIALGVFTYGLWQMSAILKM